MAKSTGAGKCKSCGTARGVDHCMTRNMEKSLMVKANDPTHPSKNGDWDSLFKSMLDLVRRTNGRIF